MCRLWRNISSQENKKALGPFYDWENVLYSFFLSFYYNENKKLCCAFIKNMHCKNMLD